MPVQTPPRPQPLVLVVDDDEQALEIAKEAFNDASCAVIPVRDPEDAIRQLRASPGVDLVYTDVKLTPKQGDTSGIFLGDFVKAERPEVPVAIYSINFREDELNSRLHEVAMSQFDLVLPRGGSPDAEFPEQIAECVALATNYRDARFNASISQLADTPDSSPEFSVVREFTIGCGAPSRAEVALRESGYSLRILSLYINDDKHRSVVTWLLEFDGRFAAEVYEAPHLHAMGDTAEEALTRLVSTIAESPPVAFAGGESNEAISRLLLSLGGDPADLA